MVCFELNSRLVFLIHLATSLVIRCSSKWIFSRPAARVHSLGDDALEGQSLAWMLSWIRCFIERPWVTSRRSWVRS